MAAVAFEDGAGDVGGLGDTALVRPFDEVAEVFAASVDGALPVVEAEHVGEAGVAAGGEVAVSGDFELLLAALVAAALFLGAGAEVAGGVVSFGSCHAYDAVRVCVS